MTKFNSSPDLTLQHLEGVVFDMYQPILLGGDRIFDLTDQTEMQHAFEMISQMSGLSIRTVMRYGTQVRASMAWYNDFTEAMRRGEYAS